MCKAAITKDGTVYLGGTFKGGGTFGGTRKIVADELIDENGQQSFETYLAAYSPQGKLRWVKTSANRAYFHAIAANNRGVFVGYNVIDANESFGEKIDTTGDKTMVISHFDKKGKLDWSKSTGTDRSEDLKLDRENNLYILGTFRNRSGCFTKSGVIGTDTLAKNNKVFIARFSEKGEYQWVKEANIPIHTRSNPFRLHMDNCGNMYLTGYLSFGMKTPMSLWDKAFLKGMGYGGAPLVARFKNTLPKNMEKTESCVISPGPWKIRNYPNPFKYATTFEYSLSYADKASIEIYSLNGQLVQTLFSNKDHTVGKHEFQLSNALSTGTYLVVIKGTETIATCKISVIN